MNIRQFLSGIFLLAWMLTCMAQPVRVLGVAQDGGFPHIGCQAKCQEIYLNPEMKRFVVSLAVIDETNQQWYLFEATPDFKEQLQYFQELTKGQYPYLPAGIFLTHAHMGHYTGLMHLGREALGAKGVKVYTLPGFKSYLETNGPWSQLVKLDNIELVSLYLENRVQLGTLTVQPFEVPHRDEYAETAGYSFEIRQKKYLFIPDIDKWSKWDRSIIEEVQKVDFAFLDASFYEDGELPNRSMEEVPHPFVTETIALFEKEPDAVKNKVYFIHMNHTNPLLWDHEVKEAVRRLGFEIAEQGKGY